jgi:hypothetical protein
MRERLTKRAVLLLVMTLTAMTLTAVPASANSDVGNYYYTGGDRLEAKVWIQSIAWSCGNWSTSAYLHGNNPARAQWIKNTAQFHANGVGASLAGANISGSGSDGSAAWTNYNAYSSDLAGNLCANWLTWYVSASSTATSYVPKYGSPRSAVAAV